MNKLPNTVVAIVPRGRGYSRTSRLARPTTHRIRWDAGKLVCRWQRDPVSHQLRCVWILEIAECTLEERPRLRLAG
jgi:hypothetical protein